MSGAVRVAGAAVAAVLGATGALHAVWAVTPWPLGTPEEFADAVVGTGDGVPPAAACVAVAGLLGTAAYLVGAEAGVLPGVGPGGCGGPGCGRWPGCCWRAGSAGRWCSGGCPSGRSGSGG